MTKKAGLTFLLLLTALWIGSRVEWLNAQAGYPLPAWRNPGEGGFSRSEKMRYSPLASNRFWEDPETAERKGARMSDRPRLQREAAAWNNLLGFGWYAFLQIPVLTVLSGLLFWWRFQPLSAGGNGLWLAATVLTALLIGSAFYRDYTYRIYGL